MPPVPRFATVASRLRVAQATASAPTIDRLVLNPLARGIPGIDVHARLVAARAHLTIIGASTLDLTIEDPDWLVERSGLLDIHGTGRMAALEVALDTLLYRLVKAARSDPTQLSLTFEDRVVALLRQHRRPRSWSRGSVTRAQAIEAMVAEVKTTLIPFYSPEKARRQPVDRPDYPATAPARNQTGFDDGTRLRIKGQVADAQQLRELATAMGVADQENAPPRATLAMLVAGIGESGFRAIPNAAGSNYWGVFQGSKTTFKLRDTEGQARSFLRGGKGFQQGGAIRLSRDNKSMSVGEIATRVEASGEPPSFYQQHHDEATKIRDAWAGGDTSPTDRAILRRRSYQFTRGLNGQRETSWEAGTRLAEEVRWRLFAAAGVVAFVSDDWLITTPASFVITDPEAAGLLERPTYDWDEGKLAGSLDLRVRADRWSIVPGGIVAFLGSEWGPVAGRWIVETVDQNLLDPADCTVTLTKPVAPLAEPASELIERPAGGARLAGAERAVAWARSKVGHYKEEWGNNRGTELDRLEQQFHMVGQPWCAIFATTAVAHGAGDQVKTASVAQIRAWATEGSYGYKKGLRHDARPGDLYLIGNDHVALVAHVRGDHISTIEGNTSAGKVSELTRLVVGNNIARPDYLP